MLGHEMELENKPGLPTIKVCILMKVRFCLDNNLYVDE